MLRVGRSFQRLWLATAVSAVGDGMLISGFQLLAERKTANEFQIASVFAIGRIPWAAALLFGAWADRRNARSVLVGADVFRSLLLSCLGVLLLVRAEAVSLLLLMVAIFCLNAASVCFFCGMQRAFPMIVQDRDLERASGYQEVALTGGEMLLGPSLGGVLFLAGKGPVIGDALSFAGSAALLTTLPSMPASGGPTGAWHDIKAGGAHFRSSPVIRSLTSAISVAAFLQAYTLSTLVIMGKITFGLSDAAFGLFLTTIALGSIVGGFVAPRTIDLLGGSTIPAIMVILGLCYLACIGVRSATFVALALAVEGVGIVVANVYNGVARTRLTPPELRGRVVGLSRAFIYGAQVPGALTAGVIARQLGTDWVFGIAGTAFVVLGLAIARPLRRTLRENPGWQAGSQPEVSAQAEVD